MTAPPDILSDAMNWFRASRFGLFVHWGLYAQIAGNWKGKQIHYIGEWSMHGEKIPVAEYESLARQFNPTAFDAKEWVRLAEEAGARYLVLTTKHHEGFAMYHSKVDPYNIVDATPFGRDPLAELAEACKGTSVKLGIYYSQCVDWHEAHGGNLPDDWKDHGRKWGNDWGFPPGSPSGFDEYLARKVKPQLTELLTNYGPLAVLWFDTPTAGLRPEQAKELYDLVREKQPGCLMCTRLGCGLGDYDSLGDNQSPAGPMDRVAESPVTMNETWGYKANDQDWKSAPDMVNMISDLASKNCNFLLNLGPQPDGRIPDASVERLKAMGSWLKQNGEAIYNTDASPSPVEPPWGRMTSRSVNGKHTLYLHVTDESRTSVAIRGLTTNVLHARLLHSAGGTTSVASALRCSQDHRFTTISLAPATDSMPRVVALDLAASIAFDNTVAEQDDGTIVLSVPQIIGDIHGLPWNGWAGKGESGHCTIRFDRSGDYDVMIYTGGIQYNGWAGGHGIQLTIGTEILHVTTKPEEPVQGLRTRHYPVWGTHAGRIKVTATEDQMFRLKIIHIEEPGVLFISRLIFRRVDVSEGRDDRPGRPS